MRAGKILAQTWWQVNKDHYETWGADQAMKLSSSSEFHFTDEPAVELWAQQFAVLLRPPLHLYFSGELGVGKTTLIRAILRALGVQGRIKSPSFAIVESYEVNEILIYHLDLYRIADPEALEYIGIYDYLAAKALCFIEWPERGGDLIPTADLSFSLSMATQGRECKITANTPRGKQVLNVMS